MEWLGEIGHGYGGGPGEHTWVTFAVLTLSASLPSPSSY